MSRYVSVLWYPKEANGRPLSATAYKSDIAEIAPKVLMKMHDDPKLMWPGRRNDDTVNLLICCKIIGIDPDTFLHRAEVSEGDILEYQYHKDRIEPYLDDWCPEGSEWLGYDYVIYTPIVRQVNTEYFGKEK